MKQLCNLIEVIQKNHLRLIFKDFITIDCHREDDNINLMSEVFNELEKDMIRARVKSEVTNGKQIGIRYLTIDDVSQKVKNKYPLWVQLYA